MIRQMIRQQMTARRLALGYLAALAAAFCYGSSALIARKIVSDYSSPMVASAFSLTMGAIIVAALFHRHMFADAARAPREAWLWVALSGGAATWGVSFLFLGLTYAPVVSVSPMIGTAPLVSILLTHIFLQRLETVTWRTFLGALMVVGGVALIALGTV